MIAIAFGADGRHTTLVKALDGHLVRAFAATENHLWAVSSTQGASTTGYLWRSQDGLDWTAVQKFKDMRPLDVAIHAGQVYVGGRGDKGRGVLWGPSSSQTSLNSHRQHNSPSLPQQGLPAAWQQPSSHSTALDRVLQNPATYTDGNAQTRLAKALIPVAMEHTAEVGQQLTDYLNRALPVDSAQLFGGNASASATHVMQWYVLWAMGLNGHGYVPLEILQEPWTEPANDQEKYWHPAPAAAWTVARLGQDDPSTIAAIIDRLTTQDDPLWLVGDFVGALHTLTGKQFGYDVTAWQQWWHESAP